MTEARRCVIARIWAPRLPRTARLRRQNTCPVDLLCWRSKELFSPPLTSCWEIRARNPCLRSTNIVTRFSKENVVVSTAEYQASKWQRDNSYGDASEVSTAMRSEYVIPATTRLCLPISRDWPCNNDKKSEQKDWLIGVGSCDEWIFGVRDKNFLQTNM